MIDTDAVQRWLDACSQAWERYDPAEIGALFSEDAEYRLHLQDLPDAELEAGLRAVVRDLRA